MRIRRAVAGWSVMALAVAVVLLLTVTLVVHGRARAARLSPDSGLLHAVSAALPGPSGTPACTSAVERAPVGGSRIFVHNGARRHYVLSPPHFYNARQTYPVVVDFHGFKADSGLEEQRSRMGAIGAGREYFVVTPDALGAPSRWNTPGSPTAADDFGFVDALLTDLAGHYCLDAARIYATGHSNGAEFAAALVCASPRFAAVAMVSSTFAVVCPDGRAPATMAVHGTADPSVPYAGGRVVGAPAPVPAALAVIRGYAGRYRCDPRPESSHPIVGVVALRYTGCAGGGEVRLDTVIGGTHFWPSSPEARRDRATSKAGRTFDATGAILDFFAAHRLAS
ncbi:plasmid partitioning protein [Frankia sp. Ag45/Mut15]|uniref:Plasmid partitioning protein n=1 Tax=Frankia umida TaxID=573489 RepID=A0ABT0JY83_9ACTN|nr:plasmid partitioning protein [Frankia umida]MCK9876400.1 plasmid partitioning protein [Frankia umida]